MIGVKPQGRLGNQMFQYAFAYAQAKKLKTLFFVGKDFEKYAIIKYFKLRWFEKYYLKLAHVLYIVSIKLGIKYTEKLESGMFVPKDVLRRVANNDYWTGYFQTEEYFKAEHENIKKLFSVKKEYIQKFEEKYKDLFQNHEILVIHVRRTDYVTWGNESWGGEDMTLPMQYYHKAIKKIGNIDTYKIIVLSDDIDFCKEEFKCYPSFIYERNSEIIDFQIIQHADAMIISNSTFSWWGAYLSNKPNPKVFAPKHWIGFKINQEIPRGIMYDKFEWIDTHYEKQKS